MQNPLETIPGPAAVEPEGQTALRITRRFNALCDLVWQAFTTPAWLQRWLRGPQGAPMTHCAMDLQPGGHYRWRWRDCDGRESGLHGSFSEVTPPNRLLHSQYGEPAEPADGPAGPVQVELEFREDDGVTTVVTQMDFGTPRARDAALEGGMAEGMEASYRRLDDLLEDAA